MSWPTDDDHAVEVWVGPDAVPVEIWASRGCDGKPHDSGPLPQGLRGTAHVVYAEECGERWLLVRYRDGQNNTAVTLPVDRVSRDAPKKNVWEGKPALRSTTIGIESKPLTVTPLDDPRWSWPHLLAYGETVEVIDEEAHVVRDALGHELALPRYAWPTADRPHVFGERPLDERTPRLRFVVGKALVEAKGRITRVPSSSELVAQADALRGHAFWLEFRPDWLTTDRRFSAEWLDPTGQTLDHACPKPLRWDENLPCGRYWLDYTAFGAWWPTADVDVIGIADGTIERGSETLPVLRLVVKHPFDSGVRVSPTWDGFDPGAVQSTP
jgi:hypothetical protein